MMRRNQAARHRKKPASPSPLDSLPKLVTVGELSVALKVDPKTAKRWARDSKIRSCRTPGGQLRFFAEDVEAIVRTASQ